MTTMTPTRSEPAVILDPPSSVTVATLQRRQFDGETIWTGDVILRWPQTGDVLAKVALWRERAAAKIPMPTVNSSTGSAYYLPISAEDFLSIRSTREAWDPILEAFRSADHTFKVQKKRRLGPIPSITKTRFERLKLKPELTLRDQRRRTLYRRFRDKGWEKIRKDTIEAAQGSCQICGSRKDKGMICHEMWRYDDRAHVAALAGFQLICPDCNSVIHLAWSSVGMWPAAERDPAKALESFIRREHHILKIDGISEEEREAIYAYAIRQEVRRSHFKWSVRIDPAIRRRYPFLRGVRL